MEEIMKLKRRLRRIAAGLLAGLSMIGPAPAQSTSDGPASDAPSYPPSGGSEGGGGGGGGGGVGIGIDLTPLLRSIFTRPAPEAVALAREGPRLPAAYAFASLRLEAVVKGGWPVVVAYELAPGAAAEIEFALADGNAQRFRLPAPPAGAARERRLLTAELPPWMGKVLATGTVSVHLEHAGDGSLPPVRLFGLGCGPLAVGSVAIDEVVFEPGRLRLAAGERAFYGFHSKSDFSKAGIDIARLEGRGDGARLVRVRSEPVTQSVARDAWVGREPPLSWNGRDQSGAPSTGAHLLYVRAWAPDPGDWVIAWSPRAVEVRP
jgi:hypothetical protein